MPALNAGDLLLDVILVKQGLFALVELDAVDVPRHHDLHELAGPLEGLRLVDQYRVDLAVIDVADRADDHVAFFVDADRTRRLPDAAHDRPPEPQEVVQVPMQIALGAVGAGRADDEAQPLRRIELQQGLAELAAQIIVGDFAADADPLQPRHQHEVTTGNADVRREGRSLGADAFLDYLHEDFAAAAEDLLNRRLVADAAFVEASAAALVAGIFFVVGLAAVGQQVLVVLEFDVANVQEPIAADAEIDEHRLNTGLDIDDAALYRCSRRSSRCCCVRRRVPPARHPRGWRSGFLRTGGH